MSRVSPTGLTNEYNRGAVEDKFREVCAQLNGFSEGRIANRNNALTSIPTTGTFTQGDFVANSTPSEAGTAGSKYIVTGWICTVSGTPGTFKEARVLTGG
jgi:hypothetical protein